ncbi:amidase family protein [Nocardia concava]|uniref:amidase family protein n=1 Tax=Nocardia concava TaxID=257281 RepID=UPI000A3049D8|nr:amidase family protein [Nocardia concava]
MVRTDLDRGSHALESEFDSTVWRERGTPLVPATGAGALSGHTVAVKDLYAVAGFPLGGGVADFLGEPSTAHADVVARLLAAGADITGIAQTDEFAYSITGGNGRYGMPVNPVAPQRIPGGSSSGSAVAVARGEVSIGLGTDTAGSIRVPAAYQGLWGIRTTHGCLSRAGVLPLAQSFDAVGWMTRDLETLKAVADCLLPEQVSTPARLIVDPALCELADDDLAAASLGAAKRMGAAEAIVDAEPETWFAAFRTVQGFEAWSNHGEWIRAHPDALEPEVAQRFQAASMITEEQALAAREVLRTAADLLRAALRDRILVLPTTATPPPPRMALLGTLESGRTRTLYLTCLASIAGAPAVNIPLPSVEGIPSGLCLIGAPGMDRAILDTISEIDSDTGQFGFPG